MGTSGLGLGIDAGGTQTRWALADARGIVARGEAGAFGGAQAGSAAGREMIAAELARIASAVAPHGPPCRVWAGVTGHDAAAHAAGEMGRLFAQVFPRAEGALALFGDVEMACRLAFEPGGGYLLSAGTGSIAVFVDEAGGVHRVGGRGGLIGDEGSGYWIARRALAMLWRAEDDASGSAAASTLGRHVFAAVGGSDWAATRAFLFMADRGRFGQLARAVAAAAHDGDARALALLQEAGREVARLARLLMQRHGARPLRVAGRVWQLHEAIATALREALPSGTAIDLEPIDAAGEAARRAALGTPISPASRPSA
jgi:N-acetylglucosamine kinase-like BadF-type ATPase